VITAEIRGVEADPGPFTKSPTTRGLPEPIVGVSAPCVAICSGVPRVTTPYPELIPSLGAGGSGNEAGGGEMEYDERVAGIGVSAGKEGDMGRSWADWGWWETRGLDVV
jgi:hypothetical protein